MSDGGDCRTAQATPGLLNMLLPFMAITKDIIHYIKVIGGRYFLHGLCLKGKLWSLRPLSWTSQFRINRQGQAWPVLSEIVLNWLECNYLDILQMTWLSATVWIAHGLCHIDPCFWYEKRKTNNFYKGKIKGQRGKFTQFLCV